MFVCLCVCVWFQFPVILCRQSWGCFPALGMLPRAGSSGLFLFIFVHQSGCWRCWSLQVSGIRCLVIRLLGKLGGCASNGFAGDYPKIIHELSLRTMPVQPCLRHWWKLGTGRASVGRVCVCCCGERFGQSIIVCMCVLCLCVSASL